MRYIPRILEKEIHKASKAFPAILLTGPRRAGKTTLLRKMLPKAAYYLLEDPDLIVRVRADARSFLEEIKPPAILDEIQNVPELFNYLRTKIDQSRPRYGQWYLTGSQEAPLMRKITESMSGRAALFSLMPLSTKETPRTTMFRGGFPEIVQKPKTASIWFRSYIQTYLERDVRSISAIKDLSQFRRLLALLASRCGNILNKTDLASPLGVSVPTITEWLNILEMTSQIILLPPFYENFGKRLIKSQKIYFVDTGLLCFLLGIDTEKKLRYSPFLGAIFESFVAGEILKHQVNVGRRRELYYFRDQQGLEVDFIIPAGNNQLLLLEAKATSTVKPEMAAALTRLAVHIRRYRTKKLLLYEPVRARQPQTKALIPHIQAVTLHDLLKNLF